MKRLLLLPFALAAMAAGPCDDQRSLVPDAGDGSAAQASCCPVGWTMYSCTFPLGGSGLQCHNPTLGCLLDGMVSPGTRRVATPAGQPRRGRTAGGLARSSASTGR